MPNPRNRIKFTGDTRLPERGEDDGGGDEDVLRFEPAQLEEEERSSSLPDVDLDALAATSRSVLEVVREEVRARPVRALGGAFALGVLLAWI